MRPGKSCRAVCCVRSPPQVCLRRCFSLRCCFRAGAVAAGAMWHLSQVSVNRGHIAQSDGVVSWLLQLLSLSVSRTASGLGSRASCRATGAQNVVISLRPTMPMSTSRMKKVTRMMIRMMVRTMTHRSQNAARGVRGGEGGGFFCTS